MYYLFIIIIPLLFVIDVMAGVYLALKFGDYVEDTLHSSGAGFAGYFTFITFWIFAQISFFTYLSDKGF